LVPDQADAAEIPRPGIKNARSREKTIRVAVMVRILFQLLSVDLRPDWQPLATLLFLGVKIAGGKRRLEPQGKDWFRDLDSNQDTQLQRLMSYRLDDPGNVFRIVAEASKWRTGRARGAWGMCAPSRFLLNWKCFTLPGEVSERFKEHAWKACVGEILPWVRIPPSPPDRFSWLPHDPAHG
jgi:hypothetical protein